MLSNYLKVAVRSLLKQKALTLINILGLSIGLACFSLFLLYSVNEFSFDRFHEDADRIYRIYRWMAPISGQEAEGDTYMPMPLGPAFQEEFPDVEEMARFREDWGDEFVRVDGKIGRKGIAFTDPSFFDIFDFTLIHGNPESALQEPSSVVLTEATARQLFGESNPLGRTLEIKLEDDFVPLTVTGVVGNLPSNTSIEFNILGNFDYFANQTQFGERYKGHWSRSAFQVYVKLREGSGLAFDKERLLSFREKYYPGEEERLRAEGSWTGEGPPITYGLQPLRAIHTDTRIGWSAIDPKNIWILLAIAAGVLLIACINFTTLAIGRSAGRAREVGVRKVIGGGRRHLVQQFLTESLLLASLSTLTGLALAQLLLPFFNEMAGRELTFSPSRYPEIIWMTTGLTLLVGLLAGSYPALVLSGFRPVQVLRSNVRLGGSNLFTKSLVTFQFVVSIGLIASTLIVIEQLDYMQSRNPGFNKENVIVIDASGTDSKKVYPLFRQALEQHPSVGGIASAELGLGGGTGWSSVSWSYKGEFKEHFEYFVDHHYIDILGMELLAGRNFNPDIASDTVTSVIVNEAFIKDFGWTHETAVGQELTGYHGDKRPQAVIIGVIKNFHYRSFREEVRPQLFHQNPAYTPFKFFVRTQPGDPSKALATLETAWQQVVPNYPFSYSFLDEDINQFYHSEARFSRIVGWAGGISVFLACLGLFGLAALAAINRTKEVGIRKVLGASVIGITGLLSKDFLKLVGLAMVIAAPPGWYFMNDWLNGFAYRIDLPWWYFVAAGLVAILIAGLTVGMHGVKAALTNPVKSLRSE